MRAADGARAVEAQETPSGDELPRVRAGALQPFIKSRWRAAQGVKRQRACHIGRVHKRLGALQGDEAHGRHHLCAVDER